MPTSVGLFYEIYLDLGYSVAEAVALAERTSSRITFRGPFGPNTYYGLGDLVLYNDKLWLPVVAFTSGTTFNPADWIALTGDFMPDPGAGTPGQLLTWDASGQALWTDPPAELPPTGSDGQVLTAASGAPTWSDLPPLDLAEISYRHVQLVAASTWTVVHNLGYKPAGIVVIDSAGTTIEGGAVTYVDDTTLTLTFAVAFGGEAYVS